jgi:hypothetical protein
MMKDGAPEFGVVSYISVVSALEFGPSHCKGGSHNEGVSQQGDKGNIWT